LEPFYGRSYFLRQHRKPPVREWMDHKHEKKDRRKKSGRVKSGWPQRQGLHDHQGAQKVCPARNPKGVVKKNETVFAEPPGNLRRRKKKGNFACLGLWVSDLRIDQTRRKGYKIYCDSEVSGWLTPFDFGFGGKKESRGYLENRLRVLGVGVHVPGEQGHGGG